MKSRGCEHSCTECWPLISGPCWRMACPFVPPKPNELMEALLIPSLLSGHCRTLVGTSMRLKSIFGFGLWKCICGVMRACSRHSTVLTIPARAAQGSRWPILLLTEPTMSFWSTCDGPKMASIADNSRAGQWSVPLQEIKILSGTYGLRQLYLYPLRGIISRNS